MKLNIIILGLILFALAPQVWAGDPAVEDRLKVLETKQQDLSDSLALEARPVERLFSDQFRLGGYFVLEGESIYQPQNGNLIASFTQAEFRPFALVQFAKDWSGLAEFAVLAAAETNNPNTPQRSYGVVQNYIEFDPAYVDYTGFRGVRVRLGDFFTPFGYSNIEHSESLLITSDQPLYIKDNLFPNNVGGVSLFGEQLFPFGWEVYAGSQINTDFGEANINGPTAGGRLTYAFPWARELVLGANYQYFKDFSNQQIVSSYGLDLRMDWSVFSLLIESMGTNRSAFGLYAVPAVRCGQWLFLVAFDSDDSNIGTETVDARSQHIMGVNYLVSGHLRLKLQLARVVYKYDDDPSGVSKNYWVADSQVGFSF